MNEILEYLDRCWKKSHNFKIESGYEVDLVDAFQNCPNVEAIYINAEKAMTQVLLDSRTSNLKISEYFCLFIPIKVKFLILARLYFDSEIHYFDHDTPGMLANYLSEYPSLTSMVFQRPIKECEGSPIFHRILSQCNLLVYLKYRATTLISSVIDIHTLQDFPSVKELALEVDHLAIQDTEYIKSTLTHLQTLTITINKTAHDDTFQRNFGSLPRYPDGEDTRYRATFYQVPNNSNSIELSIENWHQ
ncbi:hypothetical protein BDB01DRAFT_839119 [Pilobolus umbonatus]|nr:hypothetical protein BDB01DRAFT_839119 [Pilobolus umbonatus]